MRPDQRWLEFDRAQLFVLRELRTANIALTDPDQGLWPVIACQHGMLLRLDGEETLVRAVHLTKLSGQGAAIMHGCSGVTYVHLMFETHQVVFAQGAPSESFYPGPQALRSLSTPARHELLTLFPTLPRKLARSFTPFKGLSEAVLQCA